MPTHSIDQQKVYLEALSGIRKVFAWGISASSRYLLAQLPFKFAGIIDGTEALTDTQLFDVQVVSPNILKNYSSSEVAIILFADERRYREEIRQQISRLGDFELLPLVLPAKLFPSIYNAGQYEYWLEPCIQYLQGKRRQYISTPNQKRVLLYTAKLAKGGAERQICLLAAGFKELGWDVDLVTSHSNGENVESWEQELCELGVRRFFLGTMRDSFAASASKRLDDFQFVQQLLPYFPAEDLHRIECLSQLLMYRAPSVLVSYLDTPNLNAAVASVLSGVPKVLLSGRSVTPDRFSHIGWQYDDRYLPTLYRSLVRLDGIFLSNNSQSGARAYENWLNLDVGEIKAISNALQKRSQNSISSVRKKLKIGENTPLVVGVMRLSQEKRPDRFIEVVDKIKKVLPDVKALLIGDGNLKKSMNDLIDKKCLGETVFLLGELQDVYPFLLASDLLLLTSDVEGMPNVLLEAQQAGCAVLTNDVGGARECLHKLQTDNYVQHGDVEEMAQKAITLLNELGGRSKKRAELINSMKSYRNPEKLALDTLSACEILF